MSDSATLRIGTSGYQYRHWKEVFYPKDLPTKKWFSFYAERFDTVEINNTFYNLPEKDTVIAWRKQAPENFCYVLKYSRYGSHIKRLKDPEAHVPNFVDVARHLKGHLGPILVQLPPRWRCDLGRLDDFLDALPRKYRWVLEFRDASWLCDPVYDRLRKREIALCIHDLIDDHPQVTTADFTYWRFHGSGHQGKYANRYPHQALSAAADRLGEHLSDGLDVFAYFNNDTHGFAIENAEALRRYLNRRRA